VIEFIIGSEIYVKEVRSKVQLSF